MNKIEERVSEIRQRPGLYLGHKSLVALRHYLNGYIDGINLNNDGVLESFYPGFQEFIQDRYHITSTHGWAEIIIFYSQSDEKAFDRFYELLNEFLEKTK